VRLLVIGSEGQLARSLREAVVGTRGLEAAFAARPQVDLARPETVWAAVRAFAPDLVVNPAAYTGVDKAESEPDLAFAINRDGAAAVASAAAACGAPIIHVSTDYVFAGDKAEPYLENDPVAPTGVYGRSKLAGEQAVALANPRHLILRTAWVYAPFGANFVRTMLRLAGERDQLRVVDDQIGCPTYAPDAAAAILKIADRVRRDGWRETYQGVTHLAGPAAMTWRDFAVAVMDGSAARGGPSAAVEPITTTDYPTPAQRPANSRLDGARLSRLFATRLPFFEYSLERCLDRLIGPRLDLPRECA
jgi:dTDP-4-dehydrorhamnose reductase